MIGKTLACEDAYSKLVEIVTVAYVCDEDRVGNSLLQIWKLRFGHKAFVQTLSTWVKILRLKRRDFEAVVWSLFADDIRLRLQS